MDVIRVTLAQLKPFIGDPARNLERIKSTIEKIYNDNSDLIIFPELFIAGYYSKDQIYRISLTLDDPIIREISKLAKEYGIYIITGFAERDRRYEILYNSALFVSPQSEIKVYRKMHLPDFSVFDEARYFRRWDGSIDLWRVRNMDIGIMICYDIFFPEVSRAYTYMGAKALVGISATPDFSRPLFHKLIEARAIENTVYFVWVNNVGTYDGLGFAGGSRVVEPLGRVVYESPLMAEDIHTVDLDLDIVRISRIKRPILKDITFADVEVLSKSYRLNKI